MSLDSYDNLKQAVSDWLDRDSLEDQIQDFIDIAEARHAREIRFRQMLRNADLQISKSDRKVALPFDFLDHYFLRILAPNNLQGRRFLPGLDEVTVYELTRLSTNEKRRPCKYTIHEEIEFDSEADQDYDAELLYYVQLTPLSDANPTNALLDRAPDTYLYAALSASAPFLLNDERVPTWETLYVQARDGLNLASRKSRRGGPLVSKVAGVTP